MQSLAQMNAHPNRLSEKISVHVHPAPAIQVTLPSTMLEEIYTQPFPDTHSGTNILSHAPNTTMMPLQNDPFLAPRDDGPRRRKRRERERAKTRKARSRSNSPSPFEGGDATDFRRRVQTMDGGLPNSATLPSTILAPSAADNFRRRVFSTPDRSSAQSVFNTGMSSHLSDTSLNTSTMLRQQRQSTQVENVSQTAADDLTALFSVLATGKSPKPAVVPLRSRQLPESFFGKSNSQASDRVDTVPNDTGIYYEGASPGSVFQDELDAHTTIVEKPTATTLKIDSLTHLIPTDMEAHMAANDLGLFHGQLDMFNDVQHYLDSELQMLDADDHNARNIFQDLALSFDV